MFFGSPALAVPTLDALTGAAEVVAIVTQPDRPSGRGRKMSPPAVKEAAAALLPGVPVLQPQKIRTGELEHALSSLAPDLFVVIAYGRILPQSLLDVPRLGPWNIHASLLPALRGAAPIQWAIIRGERETGVSIMRMEAGLDTGPVAAAARTAIRDDDTAGTLGDRLGRLGAELLIAVLPELARGDVALVAQDESRATFAPPLRKEDGALDFGQPARVVSARARGVDPWPGATARLGNDTVKLFRPLVEEAPEVLVPAGHRGTQADHVRAQSESESGGPPPGTIVRIDSRGAAVCCGEGTVVFAELQFPGRTRVPASAAAAGRVIDVGARFS